MGFPPLSVKPFISEGVAYVPPFPIVENNVAICIGVAVSLPWPKARLPTDALLLSSFSFGKTPASVL